MLDFFLEFENFDYPISQISKETETKWETVEKVLSALIEKKIIKKTRKLGKAWLYMLNKESDLTKLLIGIDMKISKFFVDKEIDKQRIKVVS